MLARFERFHRWLHGLHGFFRPSEDIVSVLPTQNHQERPPTSRRTPTAIGLAVAAGVPVGLFLNASAVPFGPVLFGWLVTLAGAVFLTGGLCVLATDRYVTVGVGYAAGVAGASVVASITTSGIWESLLGPPAQFGIIFSIVAFASLFGSLPCALLKWEDKRAREMRRSRNPMTSNAEHTGEVARNLSTQSASIASPPVLPTAGYAAGTRQA
jgi:hypothetical protein